MSAKQKIAKVSDSDAAHLEHARRIAHGGWGHVHPNPMVGCVVVQDGDVVGEGHHERYGGPHAEVVALEAAGDRAEGATVYVSLEPCTHEGQTPPCTSALVEAGVGRVVYGAADPGTESGGGGAVLRKKGIRVDGPVWTDEQGYAENPAFFVRERGGEPFVALKLALSLDGRIAARPGVRTRITGPEADVEVHRLRTGFAGIMVGAGTVRSDDPRLTVREAPAGRVAPARLVVASDGAIDPGGAIFQDVESAPLHVFVSKEVAEERVAALEEKGAQVHRVRAAERGLDVEALLSAAAHAGIPSILCEGGARLADSLLRAERVHRLYVFTAPVTIGSAGLEAFPAGATLEWSAFEQLVPPRRFGRDSLVVLDRVRD